MKEDDLWPWKGLASGIAIGVTLGMLLDREALMAIQIVSIVITLSLSVIMRRVRH